MISIITVNYNDSKFKIPMSYALNKLTKNKFTFTILDNGSDEYNLKILNKLKNDYPFIEIINRQQTTLGSHAHGEALNIGIAQSKNKYTCVFDGDAVPLLKFWDELLINNINNNIKLIGATTPKHQKIKRIGAGEFPMPFFALFETEVFKKLKIDCRPNDIVNGEDTCYEWYEKFINSEYQTEVFSTFNTREKTINGFLSDCFAIEVYYYKNQLIGSHFGRGSTFGFTKYFSIMKKKTIQSYLLDKLPKFITKKLLKKKMDIEFDKWKNGCIHTINSQIN